MNESDETLLREMIEQSSETWLAVSDRSAPHAQPTIICRDPERAYYLERAERYQGATEFASGWIVEERPLRMHDAAEFVAAFGDHGPYWLGAIIKSAPFRAFIKNGRDEGWSISLSMKTDPITNAVVNDLRNNGPVREALTSI